MTTQARLLALARANSMVLILLVMVVVATIVSEGIFLQPSNLTTVLFQASVLGVLAVGQAIVILAGGLDLSIGIIALLAAVIAGSMSDPTQDVIPRLPLLLAIPVALMVSTLFGVVNGAFAAFTRMPMFIVTLATSLAGGSIILLIGGGNAVEPGDPFWIDFGRATLASIPLPVFVWVGVVIAAALWLRYTSSGRQSLFVGSAPLASQFAGVPVVRVRFLVYSMSGLLGGIAGLLFLARTASIVPGSQGADLVLNTIAAVVIGGISLRGGQGRIIDAVVGVLVLATLTNMLALALIQPRSQSLFIGIAILLAALVNVRVAGQRSGATA
jgi:ribose/xylose/arabinose/galactoside ABC-type transport system permease subunit